MMVVKVNTGVAQFVPKIAAAVESALDIIGEYARERITAHAQTRLHTTYLDYVHGLQDPRAVVRQPGSVTITLVGQLPNMLEQGASGFDLKRGLLASPHAKRAKSGGRYIDVPFRHGKPGSTVLPPMSAGAASNMASAVCDARRALGSKAGSGSIQTQQRTAGTGGAKVGRYDQLTRIPKQYAGSTGSQFRTFRRVSDSSDKRAWLHPGFKGIQAFPQAFKDIQKDVPKIIADFVKRATS